MVSPHQVFLTKVNTMHRCIALLLLVAITAPYTSGYSNGPPVQIFADICLSMNPERGHSASRIPDNTPPPYTITVNPTTYRANEGIQGKTKLDKRK